MSRPKINITSDPKLKPARNDFIAVCERESFAVSSIRSLLESLAIATIMNKLAIMNAIATATPSIKSVSITEEESKSPLVTQSVISSLLMRSGPTLEHSMQEV